MPATARGSVAAEAKVVHGAISAAAALVDGTCPVAANATPLASDGGVRQGAISPSLLLAAPQKPNENNLLFLKSFMY
jgi:hypothetical protein